MIDIAALGGSARVSLEVWMRKANIIAGIVFLAFSVTIVATSLEMQYYSSIGPGPGFFSFWLSLILSLLSAIWLIQTLMSKPSGEEGRFFPRGKGLFRILSIIGALVLMFSLMDIVGFQLMMFAFLLFLLVALGRVNLWITMAVSVTGSFGLYFVFTKWLDVQLPQSAISWLAAIGM